jgi:hypothetical protein
MSAAEVLATLPGHLHWCPRCDASWDCADAFDRCSRGGGVVVEDHCDRPVPWDEE